jgi:hypothetical protein
MMMSYVPAHMPHALKQQHLMARRTCTGAVSSSTACVLHRVAPTEQCTAMHARTASESHVQTAHTRQQEPAKNICGINRCGVYQSHLHNVELWAELLGCLCHHVPARKLSKQQCTDSINGLCSTNHCMRLSQKI